MNKSYRGVIFDLDGTLLNTIEDLQIAVNNVLRENGEPERTLEQIRKAVGNGNKMLMELSLKEGKSHPKFEELYRSYVKYYLAHDTVMTKPYDGIREVLSYCRNNSILTGVISNKVHSATSHLIEHYFPGEFDVVMGDNEVRPRKPAPDVAYESLKALNLKPKEVLYVGDAPVDSDFSKRAGLDCVLVTYGFNSIEVLREKPCVGFANKPLDIIDFLKV